MALVDKIFVSGSWVSSALRFTNVGGTPITSVAENGSGELIFDEYVLTLSSVAGGTATVTVQTSCPNNPYNGKVVNGVPLDGATAVKNIIPGLSIVFSNTGANTNHGTVLAGLYLGVFDSAGVDAGVPSDGVRHQVTNDGDGDVSACIATLLTQAIYVKKTGNVFSLIKPQAPGATEKTAGGGSSKTLPYQIKAITVTGSGGAKVATIQLNTGTIGSPVWTTFPTDSILDLTTNTNHDGVGLKAITPDYIYRVILGDLTGLEFAISPLVVNNDIANVLIFANEFVQTAPDVSGAEGTYGVADVDLTESGQATGVIRAGHVAYYWVRIKVPVGGGSESNPRPGIVTLEGSETVGAGWLM